MIDREVDPDVGDVAWGEEPDRDEEIEPGEDEPRREDGRARVDGRAGGGSSPDDQHGTAPPRLLSIPDSLRAVDVRVGGRAIRGLLLVAAVVVAVLLGRWWWVQQGAGAVPVEHVQVVGTAGAQEDGVGVLPEAGPGRGEEAPGEATSGEAASGEAASGGATAGAEATSGDQQPGAQGKLSTTAGQAQTADGSVLVHVLGQVNEPGVVELRPGARVVDAVQAAGGLTDGADHGSVNLARPVVDGEQVWVAAPGEEPPPGLLPGPAAGAGQAGTTGQAGTAGQGTVTGPGTAGATGAEGGGQVDLNRATQADLEELPGIGPVTAGRILTWRDEHGSFSAVEELMEVSGIGERTFAELEPLVTVGG